MHDLASSVAGKSIKILDENILDELERNTNSTGLLENAFEKVLSYLYIHYEYDSSCQVPTLLLEQKKMREV